MSRVGKQPVVVPSGVKVEQKGRNIHIEGSNGKLDLEVHSSVEVAVNEGSLQVSPASNSKLSRAMYGTTRQLLHNMVQGVTKGFERRLEIEGVGYNAKVVKDEVVLQIGFCHPVELKIPEGVKVEMPKPTQVTITGPDKQTVGQFAANIRRVRPPEPYKGKGIRYHDEVVLRKAGKSLSSG